MCGMTNLSPIPALTAASLQILSDGHVSRDMALHVKRAAMLTQPPATTPRAGERAEDSGHGG